MGAGGYNTGNTVLHLSSVRLVFSFVRRRRMAALRGLGKL